MGPVNFSVKTVDAHLDTSHYSDRMRKVREGILIPVCVRHLENGAFQHSPLVYWSRPVGQWTNRTDEAKRPVKQLPVGYRPETTGLPSVSPANADGTR